MSASAGGLRHYFFAVSAQQYSRALTWSLIAPLLILLLAAFVWPILKFLSLSVLDPAPTTAHFAEIISRDFYWTILIRTFRTGLIVTVLTLLLGYPVAWVMANVRGLRAAAIAAIVILPLWISILVRTFVWTIFLGRTGLINKSALGLGIIDQPMRLLNTETAVWLAMTQILLPVMILPIYASLKAIPPELGKAAEGMGAGKASVFRHIILPLSLPGVAAGSVLVFIMSLGFFITPMLIGGPRSMTIAMLITEQATKFLDWPEAAALSTVLMAITLAVVVIFNRALRLDRVMGVGLMASEAVPIAAQSTRRIAMPRIDGAKIVVWGFAGLVLLFMAIPTLIVIPVSLNTSKYLDFPPDGLTLRWYREFLGDPKWIAATTLSFRIAATVTAVSLVIGTMASLAVVRGLRGGGVLINALVTAPLIVPGIVYAIAVLLFFTPMGLSGTFWGYVLAHTAIAVPYVVLMVSAALYRTDPSLEMAALSLGASRFRAIWHVTLPTIRPALAAGAIFAFLTSFDDATISFFLANLSDVTLPRKMFENLQFFISPVLAAVATLLTLFTLVLAGLAQWLRARAEA